jgi:hypothetical protein
MSYDKKRKTVEELLPGEQPKAASSLQPTSSTKYVPRYVYTVQELRGGPYTVFEHDLLGVYMNCEVANKAAHDHHNKNSPYGEWTIRKPIEPEHEHLRDGKNYSSVPDDDLEESPDGQIGCVRRRHDGGLRFGASSESETCVVWVERKELDLSQPAQGTSSIQQRENNYSKIETGRH